MMHGYSYIINMESEPMPLTKNQERILNRLERKHSKKEAHIRDYFKDREEINLLFREGAIDQDHATILLDRSKSAYDAAREALKPKRVGGTPIGTYLRPRASIQAPSIGAAFRDCRSIVGNLLGLVFIYFLAVAIF